MTPRGGYCSNAKTKQLALSILWPDSTWAFPGWEPGLSGHCSMSRSSLAVIRLPGVVPGLALIALAAHPAGQEPLFTFAQMSDSQPQSRPTTRPSSTCCARSPSGTGPGAPAAAGRPRAVRGRHHLGQHARGVGAAKQKLDTWLTANDIPFLAVPGNHDVNNSDTALYEEYIADSGVWDAGSAAFTGHNGRVAHDRLGGAALHRRQQLQSRLEHDPQRGVSAVAARVDAAQQARRTRSSCATIRTTRRRGCRSRACCRTRARRVPARPFRHAARAPGPDGRHQSEHLGRATPTRSTRIAASSTIEVFPTQLRAHVVVLNDNPTSAARRPSSFRSCTR